MYFCLKGTQTAEEYSKGTWLQVPPEEAQSGISFTRNLINVGLPFQGLAKANT